MHYLYLAGEKIEAQILSDLNAVVQLVCECGKSQTLLFLFLVQGIILLSPTEMKQKLIINAEIDHHYRLECPKYLDHI